MNVIALSAMRLLNCLNQFNGLITAIATIVLAFLSWAIKVTSEQQAQAAVKSANVSEVLRDLEVKRDSTDDPLVYLFFEGYSANRASFILQNSGRRTMFLRSLKVDFPNGSIGDIRLSDPRDLNTVNKPPTGNELRNIIITPDHPWRVDFNTSSTGSNFEIVFQLYAGNPARIRIDPSILNGYIIKAPGSNRLEVSAQAFQG